MNRKDIRIVYMGTPDFAVLPLKRLVEEGFNIVGVVTNADKPAGRGQQLKESPVKVYAKEAGLHILQPEKFRDEVFLNELKDLKADLQLVVAFKMLPEIVWNMPSMGTVNLHTSLLPDYRGAAPINWVLINGEKQTGVSTFLLKHEIDAGNIIMQETVKIHQTMNAGELHDELMTVGAELLIKTVDALVENKVEFKEQDSILKGREPKHAPKLFKEDMKIDWAWDAKRIYDFIRGLSPYPAAWCEFCETQSKKLLACKIYAAKLQEIEHTKQTGEIETDGKTFLNVYVEHGVLSILELQLAGKKRMQIEDFLRGFKMDNIKIV